jgi:hypothetical protein|nr:hypothetical protein [Kofleriaceae bacterium]
MKRLLVLGALAACGGSPVEDTSTAPLVAPADAIAKTSETGPVKALVQVWPAKPSLADPLYVRLTVTAPAGFSVDAPFQEAGDQKMGRFKVVGFVRDAEPTDGGGHVEHQTYTLEAPASGKQRVPALRLEVVDARGTGSAAAPQELLTDEVPVDIAPIPGDTVNAQLKPARGSLDADVGGVPWLWVLGAASLVAIALSGGVLAYRSARRRRDIAEKRSAYDIAIARLRALEGRGAPADADTDGWFVELSGIVRGYLERRYALRAPELTTEEFLQVAAARPELSSDHRRQLSEFLARCDQVKFAGYRPDAKESIDMLGGARGFVQDTRLVEGTP